jgi:hypothetical protein
VCNAAKAFLTSIYSQPLFSLSAINENIFAKAPGRAPSVTEAHYRAVAHRRAL